MTISILSRILVLAIVVLILGIFWLTTSINHSQMMAQNAAVTVAPLPPLPAPAKHTASVIRIAYPPPPADAQAVTAAQAPVAAPQPPAPAEPQQAAQPQLAASGLTQPVSNAGSAPPPLAAAPASPQPEASLQAPAADAAPAKIASAAPAIDPPPPQAEAPSAPDPADAGQKVASVGQDDAATDAGQAPQPAAGGGVNINAASIEALNHLKGGGSIGQAIVKHRPYRSIQDLLTKRVLRRNVFEQIKNQISSN